MKNYNAGLTEVTLKGAELRGKIINQTIFVERLIDEFLSRYFCNNPERKSEFFNLLLGEKLSFDVKRNALIHIVKKHRNNFLIENDDFEKKLNNIMMQRNILAHSLLDTSVGGIEHYNNHKELVFVKFKNKTIHERFGQVKITTLLKELSSSVDLLSKLTNSFFPVEV